MRENQNIQICIWGTKSVFFDTHIKLLKSAKNITIISVGSWRPKKPYDVVAFRDTNSLLGKISEIIKRPFRTVQLFLKLDKWCDVHMIHYMNLWYLLALSIVPLKKPTIYIPYGSDWRCENKKSRLNIPYIHKLLFKYVIHNRIDLIVFEHHFNRRRFMEMFKLRDTKKISLAVVFPIRDSFYDFSRFTSKKLPNRILIFSPRALDSFYNHDILIDIVSMSKFKNSIVLLFINSSGSNTRYLKYLMSKARKSNVKTLIINRFLSADEMARLFSISELNVNIPVDDQFGMSIMEGALMGSVPILNRHIKSYHEIIGLKNAIYIDPYSIKEASEILDCIITNKKLHKKICKINRKIFKNRGESRILENLMELISKVIRR